MRGPFVLLLWLFVALAALVVVVGIFAAIGTVDRSDLPVVDVAAEAKTLATQKVDQFGQLSAQARASGESRPVQVIFSDAEISALIGHWGRESKWWGSVDRLQVAFGRNLMVLTGLIKTCGLEFDFRLDLFVSIEQSERQVAVQRLQLGDIHTPGFVSAALLELATRTVDAGLPRIPMRIESLVLAEGELIVSGAAIP
jgi:hypothetical protein